MFLCALVSFYKFWSFWIFRSLTLHKAVCTVLAETPKSVLTLMSHLHFEYLYSTLRTWFLAHLSLRLYNLEQAAWNK